MSLEDHRSDTSQCSDEEQPRSRDAATKRAVVQRVLHLVREKQQRIQLH